MFHNGDEDQATFLPSTGCGDIRINQDVPVGSKLVLGKVIGSGSYGQVRVGFSTQPNQKTTPVAVKVIEKEKAPKGYMERFLPRELDILTKINHVHIIQLHRVLSLTTQIYIIMELAEGGDLLQYVQKNGQINKVETKKLFLQLTAALSYLHHNYIAHRDIKCENILLTINLDVKLTDFGFARCWPVSVSAAQPLSETYCGSAAYAGPEILQGHPYNPFKNDIWSLGVVLYVMISARMPFNDSNLPRMLRCMLAKRIDFRRPPSIQFDELCISLIKQMLQPDASERPTIDQIQSSQWLTCMDNVLPAAEAADGVQMELVHEDSETLQFDQTVAMDVSNSFSNTELNANLAEPNAALFPFNTIGDSL